MPNRNAKFSVLQPDRLKELVEANQRALNNLADALERFSPEQLPFLEPVRASANRVAQTAREVSEAWDQLPNEYRAALLVLAHEGWYFDLEAMEFGTPLEIANNFQSGDRETAETHLCDHYRDRLNEIEQQLTKWFPSRLAIFRDAFQAHRQGLYFASIPLFLSQIDGVCHDLSDYYFFTKPRGERRTGVSPFIEQKGLSEINLALLAPLMAEHSILLGENRRPANFSQLNRHQVLHGESLDYGSELNSLRSISLLHYLASCLHYFVLRKN